MTKLTLPQVLSIAYNSDGNKILQYLGEEISLNECTLQSKNPFVIRSAEQIYLITTKRDEPMDGYSFVLLSSRKPTEKDFQTGSLNIIEWLKHPDILETSPKLVLESWSGKFHFIKEQPENGVSGLRAPQLGALHSILAHQHNADDVAIVVMPTGTGKTETMICAMVAASCKKVLVTVPSDSLRTQLSSKFLTFGLLKSLGVVDPAAQNPIVGILSSRMTATDKLEEFISKVNVVVTTMSILTGLNEDQKALMSDTFSHLFVDEAHHSEASTWKNFISRFGKEKVFLFTATPYRNDGKKLGGKFIFNFSLKKAQQQQYYKQINFLPVREYDKSKADKLIADKAVAKLREDRTNGYNHIILARCMTKLRATEVFQYYEQYSDLNPIIVYTGKPGLKNSIQAIKEKKHSIIICVDMLGEGFDLPELKIAAIHDERQSLPITLQFIGRFTRTSYQELGEASFITNMAYPPIKEELEQLYAKDVDWNLLLPMLSEGATQKEIDFKAFLDGFNHLDNSIIPFQNIVPALSTVIYKNDSNDWKPNNWIEGIKNLNSYEHQYFDHNPSQNTLVIILGKVTRAEWGDFDTVQDLSWDMIVVYWDIRPEINRIFINTSIKGLSTDPLVKAIFGTDAIKVTGINVFRIFHQVHRLSLFNVGARKGIGKDISFQSFYGKGVQDGLRMLEQGTLIKNNIFGVGYKDGNKVSLGCSVKGKIWSYLRGNLEELTQWCRSIGEIVTDATINPDTILEHTLAVEMITSRPSVTAIAVDWHPSMYDFSESRYEICLDGIRFYLWEIDLELVETPAHDNLQFALVTEQKRVVFEIVIDAVTSNGEVRPRYKINKLDLLSATISYGAKKEALEDYFQNLTPLFWFADGSQLMQNQYVKPREQVDVISLNQVISQQWPGVTLSKESQGIAPYIQDSIQFNFIDQIRDDYELIYDDDGSGEIADIIGINNTANHIDVHLYHLKYAKGGIVSNNIENFYQVCGQAQKSLNWKYRPGREFFEHLFRRKKKKKKNTDCSRLIKGTEDDLECLLNAAKWTKELKFHIYIVQPGLLKANASKDILLILGSTAHYLHTVGNVDLKVYTS